MADCIFKDDEAGLVTDECGCAATEARREFHRHKWRSRRRLPTTEHINGLYKEALSGDKKAEEALFHCLDEMFWFFIRQRFTEEDACEDIVQTALMKIAQSYRRISIRSTFAGWAYRVFVNELNEYLRHKYSNRNKLARIKAECNGAELLGPDPLVRVSLKNCLKKILNVRPRLARVVNLRYQGYTTKEICGKMKIDPGYCRVMLHRARVLLTTCLKEHKNPL